MENQQGVEENKLRKLARRLSIIWACLVVFYLLDVTVSNYMSLYYHFSGRDVTTFAGRVLFVAAVTWLPRKFELAGGIIFMLLGNVLVLFTILLGSCLERVQSVRFVLLLN